MANNENEIKPIDIDGFSDIDSAKKVTNENISSKSVSIFKYDENVKLTCIVPYEISEKIKDIAYSKHTTQKHILLEALKFFVKNNPVSSRPEELKKLNKPGRKKKHNTF